MLTDAVRSRIESHLSAAPVVLFMKGTPEAPQCGFSLQVAQILNHLGVTYKAINVLADGAIRDGIKTYSNWPTIPQLYIKGEFIGGCDIVKEMYASGELQALLKNTSTIVGLTSISTLLISPRIRHLGLPPLSNPRIGYPSILFCVK